MIDKNSETWRAVVAWANERRETSRDVLSGIGLDERDADVERGRLANLRELVSLPEPKVMPGVDFPDEES